EFVHHRLVNAWRVKASGKSGAHVHQIAGGAGHALLVPVVGFAFEALRISASLWDGRLWWPIHSEASLTTFEIEHGKDTERYAYNDRMLAGVQRRKKPSVGEHAGCSDLFLPVMLGDQVVAVLVIG